MGNDILGFFQLERQIFGVCPKCGRFFRLSDCKIHIKEKKPTDWLDELMKKYEKIEEAGEKLGKMEKELREAARVEGRKLAHRMVGKIDTIFTPRGLTPDDARGLFHPIDYVVFNGMKSTGEMRNIVLLDRERTDTPSKQLQRSIEKTIESGNYEWQTMVIDEIGNIKYK
jgi:predicted Holliday junction resolvase-like endonuclease